MAAASPPQRSHALRPPRSHWCSAARTSLGGTAPLASTPVQRTSAPPAAPLTAGEPSLTAPSYGRRARLSPTSAHSLATSSSTTAPPPSVLDLTAQCERWSVAPCPLRAMDEQEFRRTLDLYPVVRSRGTGFVVYVF